jgi:hypothetical protein
MATASKQKPFVLDSVGIDIGAEPLAGQFERGPGSGRAFEEHVNECPPLEKRQRFEGFSVLLDIGIGEIQRHRDGVRRQPLDSKLMAMREPEGGSGRGCVHKGALYVAGGGGDKKLVGAWCLSLNFVSPKVRNGLVSRAITRQRPSLMGGHLVRFRDDSVATVFYTWQT